MVHIVISRYRGNIPFSSKSKAKASELLEYPEDMFNDVESPGITCVNRS